MSKANRLFQKTYARCQKWQCRQFSLLEKFRDFFDESVEFFEAILMGKSKEEIGLEYGDVLFALTRHAKNEKISWFRKSIFLLMPQKHWLEKKSIVFDERYKWWMENHGMHSIRNYKNKEKRKMLIDRKNGKIAKDTWIK